MLMCMWFSVYVKGKGFYVVKIMYLDNLLLMEGVKMKMGKVVSTLARDVEATCKKVWFYDLDIVCDVKGKGKGDVCEYLVGFCYKCWVVG